MAEFTVSCSECRQQIICNECHQGQQITCPHCNAGIPINAPEPAKTPTKTGKPIPVWQTIVTVAAIWLVFLNNHYKWFGFESQAKPQPEISKDITPAVQQEPVSTQPAQLTERAQAIRACTQKIYVRLDRMLNEPMNFTGGDSRIKAEEARLKTLANTEKVEIGDIIAELGRVGAPKNLTENATTVIDQFFNDYGLAVTYEKSWGFYFDIGNKAEAQKMRTAKAKVWVQMSQIAATFENAK